MPNRIVLLGIVVGSLSVSAQTPLTVPKPAPPEASVLAEGWSALAKGDAVRAATIGAAAVQHFPRNPAAVSLLVQAELVRGGALAGLTVYERWLGQKRVEDAYVLRQVALSAARELTGDNNPADARRDAYQALADEGDPAVMADLTRNAAAGAMVETQILATLGHEDAIRKLITEVKNRPGAKQQLIAALASTHSRLVVAPLLELLSDTNSINRAAAADALGQIGATEAIDKIRPMLQNEREPFVRLTAAGALYRLKDTTGVAYLREVQNSEYPQVRLSALRLLALEPDGPWMVAVRALAADPDADVRRQAAELIAPYDPETAKAVLEGLAADPNIAIREEAARIYLDKVASDFGALRRYLRSTDAPTRVHAAARILALTR